MAELLLEIRTGGYPLAPLPAATRELKDQLVRRLRDAGMVARQSAVAWGPRRMTVILRGLPAISTPGGAALVEVARAVEGAAAAIGWPEAYRGGPGNTPWPRPVSGVLALFDGAVIPATVGGVAASATTVGHPTLSPRRFRALDGDDYGRKLALRGIEVRPTERVRRLSELIEAAAKSAGGRVLADPDLVETLAHGCEIPGVVVGSIDPELDLPRELIQACCRRQRGLVVVQEDRAVAFVTAIDRPDDPEGRVRRGAESWLANRLAALASRYREDQRVPLAQRAERIAGGVSESAHGSFGARIERSIRLAAGLCADLELPRPEVETVTRALRLLHADRSCGVVRELPELQGMVGGLLARAEGLPDTVWQAIYDAGDGGFSTTLPRGRPAQVVALADRLDALATIVAGSREPRSSQGAALADRVVGLLVESRLRVDLDLAGARAVRLHPELGARSVEALAEVRRALSAALVRALRDQGFAADEIRAVLAADVGRELPLILERLSGLRSLRAESELRGVAQAARRLVDILHEAPECELDVALLVEDAEKDLYVLLPKLRRALEGSMLAGRYREWLGMMATLAAAVDRFFREVLVRDEVDSLRLNRLALLQSVQRPFAQQVRLAELVARSSDLGISAPTAQ